MNNVGTKLTITFLLVISAWQLGILIGKFQPFLTDAQAEKPLEAQELSTPQNETPLQPDKISIEKIDLELPVIAASSESETCEAQPNMASYTREGDIGVLGNIQDLKTGDEIILYSNDRKAIYKVSTKTTSDNTDSSTLTLFTCDQDYSEKRYLVTATLINKE